MLDEYLQEFFADKAQAVIDKNIEAGRKGYAIGLTLSGPERIDIQITPRPEIGDGLFMSGDEAVALGAIAGGCRFIAAYPMSPSTAVFTYLAQHGAEFEIVVEQAEDEIAAMNMAIGAWYAGARALVSSAGGGFSLMTEGLSLAGMLESPLVVHIAQRPGPATGLPTRTEQGDLNLALYAGHGEFPRAILTPGTLGEAFYLTQRAFNLADKYQVPVFVLTDQFLLESHYNTPAFDLSGLRVENQFVETADDYRRYALTESGVSPRGIPGLGSGLVVLDSDEHDEEGHITEDPNVRKAMVDKRMRKLQGLAGEIAAPELIGGESYRTLVIAWGSNYHVVIEALRRLGKEDVAFLHFKQVYPVPPETEGYLKRAGRTIVVENNATGQFAQLLKSHTGIEVEHKVLKYTGWPFSVEELAAQLGKLAL